MPLFRGIVFLVSLTLACLTTLVLFIPHVLLLLVHSKRIIRLRRRYADVVSGMFLDFAAALHVTLCGTKIFVYSTTKEILKDRGALILCNHRCRVDWMYAGWCYTALTRTSPQLRIVLKESLRSIPFFGWAMQIVLYIFLERKRDVDLQHIERSIKYLLNTGKRPSIFLFPEGTDLSPSNVIKNCEYAKENKLPEWKYVLLPKPSGLRACLLTLQGHDAPVHDITIAYKDFKSGQRPTENGILKGEFPKEIHLCVKRMSPDSIPTDRAMLERWLKGSFAKKERLLRSFYENGSCALTADANTAVASPASTTSPKNGQSDDLWPPLLQTSIDTKRPLYTMSSLILLNIVSLVIFPWFRWTVTALILLCAAFRMIGGADNLELLLHAEMILATEGGAKKQE